jgi:shikimate kinase
MLPTKISLIGMPSAGKTTISEHLAKAVQYHSIDLDHMVEEKENKSLISILEDKGSQYFLNMEYGFLKDLKETETVVIGTAGSIIYHEEAMKWLKDNTKIIFIDTDLDIIKERLSKTPKAIVGLKEKGLDVLWEERLPIYRKWADIEISTHDKNIEQIVSEIQNKIKSL